MTEWIQKTVFELKQKNHNKKKVLRNLKASYLTN